MSLRIMVVDDEPNIPTLMRSLATPLGHTVLSFNDYQAAVEKGGTQRFDLVFVGMRSPELGGLELTHRIRNSQPNRETFIVMLSAANDIACWRKAFGEGADLVLTKPVPADGLRRILAAFPEWKEKRRAARMPLLTKVTCTWLDRQFSMRSLNISQSGMLLQPSIDLKVGSEVALEFEIAEVRASLNAIARVVRTEGTERIGVEFIGLAQEHHNAIQLYVMGHLKNLTPARDSSSIGLRRLF